MTNENAEQFWNRVKELTKQNKITQDTLAKECGVTVNVLKSWIFNNRLPDVAQAIYIAKTLNTSVEFLVRGSQLSELETKLINAFNEVSEQNKPLLVDVVEVFTKH